MAAHAAWGPPDGSCDVRMQTKNNTFALVCFNTLAAHAAEGTPYGSCDVEMQRIQHFRLGCLPARPRPSPIVLDVETQRVQHFHLGVFEKCKECNTLAAHAA